MAIRNKITALISREKNREKIDFLEEMIRQKDEQVQEAVNITTEIISQHQHQDQIFRSVNENLDFIKIESDKNEDQG